MGDKTMCRNLLYELWNQVEKYRKHGETLPFDFQFGATNFKDWYRDHRTFGLLGDYYCSWNNLVFASEMYRMAIERILKCTVAPSSLPFSPLTSLLWYRVKVKTWSDLFKVDHEDWNKFELEEQDEALRYLIARAECLWNCGSHLEVTPQLPSSFPSFVMSSLSLSLTPVG
jgi:hypothetical protein